MAEKEFKVPTNIEFQKLLMAHRVLTRRGGAWEDIHVLSKYMYNSKAALGLEFRDGFRPAVASEANLSEQLSRGDEYVITELEGKVETVHEAVIKRIGEIKAFLDDHPDAKLEKTDIERNIELLSEVLQFSDIQKQALMFFACAPKGRFGTILEAAYPDGDVTLHEDYIESLAVVLDIEDTETLEEELRPDSTLVGVNFLVYKGEGYAVDSVLQRILLNNYTSTEDLLFALLGPSPSTELTEEDYAYMQGDFDAISETLEGFFADKNPKTRKNMTVGGPPGTGKTQVTAVLSGKLDAPAFLVGVAEKSKATGFSLEEPTREDRINALVRCAFIVRQTGMKAILVFDEAEDILRDLNDKDTKEFGSKAFINELLDGLGAPIIYISNRTDLFDPATTRRILPYYSMNYMPFSARMNAIITKADKYTGVELSEDDVSILSKFASSLSVAVIDSCVSTVGQRKPEEKDKNNILLEIEREFERALKAKNGGLPPIPLAKNFDSQGFYTDLISASDEVVALQKAFTGKPENLAGKDFTLIGAAGTGRKSIAQFISAATGMEPRIVPIDYAGLQYSPENVHALDLERAALDNTPIIFTDALNFLASSDGHPLMQRVHEHPQATFFISDFPSKIPSVEVEEALAHLTFVIRTSNLSSKQMQLACNKVLGFEVTEAELSSVKDMSIGSIMTVKNQLEAMGQAGNKELALKRMATIDSRFQSSDSRPLGFNTSSQDNKIGVESFAEKYAGKRAGFQSSATK